jgi:hypothetical protein
MTVVECLNQLIALDVVFAVGYGDRVEFTHIEEPRADGQGVVYRPGLPRLKTLEYVAPDGVMTPKILAWLRRHKEEVIACVATLARAERAAWSSPDTRPDPTTYGGGGAPCQVAAHGHTKPGATTDMYYFPTGMCVEKWRNRKRVVTGTSTVLEETGTPSDPPDDGGAGMMPRLEDTY